MQRGARKVGPRRAGVVVVDWHCEGHVGASRREKVICLEAIDLSKYDIMKLSITNFLGKTKDRAKAMKVFSTACLRCMSSSCEDPSPRWLGSSHVRIGGFRPRVAFTLFELLLVVTIMALLVAMVLPAIKTVRDASRSAVCLSNVRQLAMGNITYAGDWKGYLPMIANMNPDWTVGQTAGLPHLVGALYLDAQKGSLGGNSGRDVLKCPSDNRPTGSPGPGGRAMEGYGYKQCVWGGGALVVFSGGPSFVRLWSSYGHGMAFTPDGNYRKPNKLMNLSPSRVLFWDSITSYSYDDPAKGGLFSPLGVNRHRRGVNMALADGSARFFDFSPLEAGDMWCLSQTATEDSIISSFQDALVKRIGKNFGIRWWDWNAEPWK